MDLLNWLQSLPVVYGYGVLFLALFVNNLGVPLPGTSILLATGLLVGKGNFSLWETVVIATTACFLGSDCGYWFGWRYGLPLLQKIHWLRLTHQRIMHLEHFFERYGPLGVFFARFVALLHPFIGIMAGTGKTPKKPFLLSNFAGSAAYALVYILAGDLCGTKWGLHQIWAVYFTGYIFLLVFVLCLLVFFWRHSIHSFFGYVYFKKR